MSDKPDPEDVEAVGDTEGVYQRDEQGDLQPAEWKVIDVGDEWKRVRPYPIPTGELREFEQMGGEMDVDELCKIMAEKFETPDRTAEQWSDTDPKMVGACIDLLTELATGETPSSEFHAEVKEELESRSGPGNSTA